MTCDWQAVTGYTEDLKWRVWRHKIWSKLYDYDKFSPLPSSQNLNKKLVMMTGGYQCREGICSWTRPLLQEKRKANASADVLGYKLGTTSIKPESGRDMNNCHRQWGRERCVVKSQIFRPKFKLGQAEQSRRWRKKKRTDGRAKIYKI